MTWQSTYRDKLTDAQTAIANVQSNDHVILGHAAGEPQSLVNELLNQKDRLQNVDVFHMVPLFDCAYCAPEMAGHFRHSTTFVGKGTRNSINDGRARFIPCFFSDLPRLIREKYIQADVALIQVSPPDKHGYMSLGVSVDYTLQGAKSASLVIAEVNEQMPRTHGTCIHVDEVDYVVECSRALPEIPLPTIGETEQTIGRLVASLVDDGCNLQLGIGSLPDAVLKCLDDKNDLGIHSEMFSDGVIDLFERGNVTNKCNNLNPGKSVATFLMGTKRLYDFVDDNPAVRMVPVDYTNNVLIASQVDNLISINSSLQVDFMGQANSEAIGPKQYSAVGGQVDFVRATSYSKGGKSILAFPSTSKRGTLSRIVPTLDAGVVVTTSRCDIHYVVTEFGIAELRGKSIGERTEALIEIAHPDFRQELKDAAANMKMI